MDIMDRLRANIVAYEETRNGDSHTCKLLRDAMAEIERLRVYKHYIGKDAEAQADEAIEQKRRTGKYPFED